MMGNFKPYNSETNPLYRTWLYRTRPYWQIILHLVAKTREVDKYVTKCHYDDETFAKLSIISGTTSSSGSPSIAFKSSGEMYAHICCKYPSPIC